MPEIIRFRPLLTRIISYRKEVIRAIKPANSFPSPFNEDHFISGELVK